MEQGWPNLVEITFNQVSDILGEPCVVEDMMRDEEDMIEQAVTVDMFSDSRLDANSVLIEDIQLEEVEKKSEETMVELEGRQDVQEMLEETMGELEARAREMETREEFSPVPRDRSNTWHGSLDPSDYYISHSPTGSHSSGTSQAPTLALVSEESPVSCTEDEEDILGPPNLSRTNSLGSEEPSTKSKINTRRNPWGNQSYAELIAQAIQSSPEGRLTLSQIYDWMISSVPYFSQRADSSSAAGWKNSIRHNLSLHQRFLKVQNEGAGKSSWWTINPERKLGIKPRRRATSGDVKSLQLKREKARRRTETLRTGSSMGSMGSTGSNMGQTPGPTLGVHTGSNVRDSPPPPHFSSYRSRTFSSPSTSPSHPPCMSDMVPVSEEVPREYPSSSSRLDSLHMDHLSLHHTGRQFRTAGPLDERKPCVMHRLKILEPRHPEPVSSPMSRYPPPLPPFQTQSYNPLDSYVTPLQTRNYLEMQEVRQPMIMRELEQLTRRKMEMEQCGGSWMEQRLMESTFDMKIRLLQEELDKLSREEEILNINQYASASNNPFFMGGHEAATKEASSFYTLRPRTDQDDLMHRMLEQELSFSPRQQYDQMMEGSGRVAGGQTHSLQTVR